MAATLALPVALAVIMFGLGLGLTVADFARVAKAPRAVIVALACQILVLPAITFGLVLLFDLPPLLSVGVMLIVAAPGGAIANLLSHLFGGNVALNLTLTGLNSVTAVFTIPLIVNFSLGWFVPDGGQIGLQVDETLRVFALILGPAAVGMLIRRLAPVFADRMERPVRIGSMGVLAIVITATLLAGGPTLLAHLASLAGITVLVLALSLVIGFLVPRAAGVDRRSAMASSFEIGLHNATVAVVIGTVVLGDAVLALPAAVYGPVSIVGGLVGGFVFRTLDRRGARRRTARRDGFARRLAGRLTARDRPATASSRRRTVACARPGVETSAHAQHNAPATVLICTVRRCRTAWDLVASVPTTVHRSASVGRRGRGSVRARLR